MKSKSVIFILLVIFCLSVWIPYSCSSSEDNSASSGNIKWYKYDKGIEAGKNLNKKIFLNFYADWCGYCKVMNKNTFRDSSVVSYLNENFISIRVNSDRERKTAAAYKVTGLPVTWFIKANGDPIGNQPGYIPPETMLPILKYIQTESYNKMKFSEFQKNM